MKINYSLLFDNIGNIVGRSGFSPRGEDINQLAQIAEMFLEPGHRIQAHFLDFTVDLAERMGTVTVSLRKDLCHIHSSSVSGPLAQVRDTTAIIAKAILFAELIEERIKTGEIK